MRGKVAEGNGLMKPDSSPSVRGPAAAPAGVVGEGAVPPHRLWHLGSSAQWTAFDSVTGLLCMLSAFVLTPASLEQVDHHASALPSALLFSAAALLASYVLGLGQPQTLSSRFRIVVLSLVFTLAATLVTTLVSSLLLYKQIGRHILVICGVQFLLIGAVARLIWYRAVSTITHRIAILSDESAEVATVENLIRHSTFPIRIVSKTPYGGDLPLAGILAERPHEIVVQGARWPQHPALLEALNTDLVISTTPLFAERHFSRIPVEALTPDWFFNVDLKLHHPFYNQLKRVIDVAAALTGMLLAAPLVLVAAGLVKLGSRGPVFYSQIRVGARQRPFRIWKIRTMRVDAEAAGAQWAREKDPRVTAIGRILRKTRVDEVPQFWNILRGDMALVGPRPERPEFVEQLARTIPFYAQRHLVKPGLTGWAQICYPYGASEEDVRQKLSFDLYYLKNASLILDVQIMLQTVSAMARGSR